jgi:uncharacterized protein
VLSPEFLAMIRCPENRSPLALADEALVARLNQAVAAGTLKNRAGQPVAEPLDGGLIRQDGTIAYPIVDGFPVLLVDEGIPLAQLGLDRGQ